MPITISEELYRELIAALLEAHSETGRDYSGSVECALWAALDGKPDQVLHELAETLCPLGFQGRE